MAYFGLILLGVTTLTTDDEARRRQLLAEADALLKVSPSAGPAEVLSSIPMIRRLVIVGLRLWTNECHLDLAALATGRDRHGGFRRRRRLSIGAFDHEFI
jgi:hypothetical protein